MARMSIEESFAASRRTSETRCWSDDVERKLILMLYSPPEALLQSAAAAANEPEGSGNTYQLSVTGPLLEEPQAAKCGDREDRGCRAKRARASTLSAAWVRSGPCRVSESTSTSRASPRQPLSVLRVVGETLALVALIGSQVTRNLRSAEARSDRFRTKRARPPSRTAARCRAGAGRSRAIRG